MDNDLTLSLLCAGGRLRSLSRPLSLRIVSDISSPAATLDIDFAAAGQLAPAIELTLTDGAGRRLFSGCCDEQRYTVSPRGKLLSLSARSAGSLLLDNEIQPQTLYNITARQFFRAFIEPFGFSSLSLPSAPQAGIFRINKGVSVWEAFRQLCFLLYGREPTLSASGEARVGRPETTVCAVISNRFSLPSALRYTSLSETHRRASIISEVVLRDRQGAYSARIANPYGNPYAVSRRRYVIPAAEFATAPKLDVLQRMTEAQLGAHCISAVLPGLHPFSPGAMLRIDDSAFGVRLMTVCRCALSFGEEGAFSGLTLADTVYV